MNAPARSYRLLVVDDTSNIHEDIRRIFMPRAPVGLREMEAALFGAPAEEAATGTFEIDSAYQGEAALELVRAAVRQGRSYAVAIVDVRMPPGWDGIETLSRLWREDPGIQAILCTAYSDYSWGKITEKLGSRDGLLVLKKPFDPIEILQMVHALAGKWDLSRKVDLQLRELDALVQERTSELTLAYGRLQEEVAEKERMEQELRLAQKLEAVGQLAAGIAHEINSPVQCIGDSAHFLRRAFGDLLTLVENLRRLCTASPAHPEASRMAREAGEAADLEFLEEEVPKAIESIRESSKRASSVVAALKELTSPGEGSWGLADLNAALANVLTLTHGAYKDVADVDFEPGELPPVYCQIREINQVFLNLVINAAHAMADTSGQPGERGRLRVRSTREGDEAVVSISDTGPGVPKEIHDRVFDPFFTTKDVGRGTGHGLAISRAIVVGRHHGSLTFESGAGQGTTFFVRLPLGSR